MVVVVAGARRRWGKVALLGKKCGGYLWMGGGMWERGRRGEEGETGPFIDLCGTCVGLVCQCDAPFPEGGWRFMRRVCKDEEAREKEYMDGLSPYKGHENLMSRPCWRMKNGDQMMNSIGYWQCYNYLFPGS